MFSRHVARRLCEYHYGELSADEQRHVEAHLQQCAKCRGALEEIRLGARLLATLPVETAPDSMWTELRQPRALPSRRWIPASAVAASVVIATVVLFVLARHNGSGGPSWEVQGVPGMLQLRPGDTLQTNSSSEAQVKIANIGQMTLDRNTRIRLLKTQSDQHRIALDHGRVEATTWAPPRLFIVETPSATAVDLGCKYTLEVEQDGSSLLHVTLGIVALERGGRETVVPAGAFCRTRPGAGPGVPFFEDSSASLQAALQKLDFGLEEPERTRQLEIVLHESRVRDALSLWYLLLRVDPQSRGLIHDRLAQLLPAPRQVTREGVIALDSKTLAAWEQVVSQLWQ